MAGSHEFHADVLNAFELKLQELMRHALPRNDLLELAADIRRIIIDRDLMALAGELPGRGQAGNAAADDADFLAGMLLRRFHLGIGGFEAESADLDGLVDGTARAALHAGIRAERTADGAWERRVLQNELERFIELAEAQEVVTALRRDARRAVELAR